MFRLGDYLLIFSVIISILILIDSFYFRKNLVLKLLNIVVLLLTLAILLITYYFIIGDFTIYYVWLYSNLATPLIYRIAGVWSGQEGTFLLWVWVIYISLLWTAKKYGTQDLFIKRALAVGLFVGIFFLIISINESPFKSIYDFEHFSQDVDISDGSGLEPILLNFWNTIHPPMTFIAYSLLTVPFAFAVVHMWEPDKRWLKFSLPWLRLSWVFFVLGVGFIGGLWTHEAGWGIWNWDPVQTASFVPLVVLTGILHAAARRKNPTLNRIIPPLTVASFILVILATFITRSGLWGSVHEFTETANNDLLIGAILLIICVGIYLTVRNLSTGFEGRIGKHDYLFIISVFIFIMLVLISLVGLIVPVLFHSSGIIITPDFYNFWTYPFVILIITVLGMCNFIGLIEKSVLYKLVLLILLLSIIFSFILPSENFQFIQYDNHENSHLFENIGIKLSILGLVPSILFALSGIIYRLKYDIRSSLNIRTIGVHIIHLGIILALIGGILSTQFQYSENLEFKVEDVGYEKEIGGEYSLKISNFIVNQGDKENWIQTATIQVYKNGENIGSDESVYLRNSGGEEFVKGSVIRGSLKDIKIQFHGLFPKPNEAPIIPITFTVVPLINLLWIGMAATGIGAFLVFLSPGRSTTRKTIKVA
ncbi:MAG: hypothetical protein E4G94_06845 [ANME-2 cluster archaeon]|nr:MAG: hypothetical protein E4G94_06845 [ANME-2 cluster archaeon]